MSDSNSMPMFRVSSDSSRRGISIMEVLFAVGVLTIGLLGVATILPVATNNASSSMRDDRSAEEVSNRIASDIAKLSRSIDQLVIPYSSNAVAVANGNRRYGNLDFSQLPDAFCIDPWFVSATNNLRLVGNANGYDRTLFPCYDRNHIPMVDPALPITVSHGVTWQFPDTNGPNLVWNTPRMPRVALPASVQNLVPGLAMSRLSASTTDDMSVSVAEDSTFGAGLFVVRSDNAMRSLSRSNTVGRFSSMVMMSRIAPGSNQFNAAVVTMQDRETVIVPGGETLGNGDSLKHQLQPYASFYGDVRQPRDEEATFAGEVVGFVTAAPKPLIGGGGGEFVFRTSAATPPNLKEGGWVCLMRQDYPQNPPAAFAASPLASITGGTVPVYNPNPAGQLKFGWFQITDVPEDPLLVPDAVPYYQTRIAVRGPDWVFHPAQVTDASGTLGSGPYALAVGAPPVYSFDAQGHPDFGTILVSMPDVVSVYQFPFRFE